MRRVLSISLAILLLFGFLVSCGQKKQSSEQTKWTIRSDLNKYLPASSEDEFKSLCEMILSEYEKIDFDDIKSKDAFIHAVANPIYNFVNVDNNVQRIRTDIILEHINDTDFQNDEKLAELSNEYDDCFWEYPPVDFLVDYSNYTEDILKNGGIYENDVNKMFDATVKFINIWVEYYSGVKSILQ